MSTRRRFVLKCTFSCWCGNTESIVFAAQMVFGRKFVVLRCPACSTHRIVPQAIRTDAEAASHYSSRTADSGLGSYDKERRLQITNLAMRRMAQVGIHFTQDMDVLDVGCADAEKLWALKEKFGFAAVGLDVDEKALSRAKSMFPTIQLEKGTILDFASRTGRRFDVVVCSAIIEHVVDPIVFLKSVKCLLKPNGQVFLLTPNSASLHYYLLRAYWRELLAIGEHIFLFNAESLNYCAHAAALRMEQVSTSFDVTYPYLNMKDLKGSLFSLFMKLSKMISRTVSNEMQGDILVARLQNE